MNRRFLIDSLLGSRDRKLRARLVVSSARSFLPSFDNVVTLVLLTWKLVIRVAYYWRREYALTRNYRK